MSFSCSLNKKQEHFHREAWSLLPYGDKPFLEKAIPTQAWNLYAKER